MGFQGAPRAQQHGQKRFWPGIKVINGDKANQELPGVARDPAFGRARVCMRVQVGAIASTNLIPVHPRSSPAHSFFDCAKANPWEGCPEDHLRQPRRLQAPKAWLNLESVAFNGARHREPYPGGAVPRVPSAPGMSPGSFSGWRPIAWNQEWFARNSEYGPWKSSIPSSVMDQIRVATSSIRSSSWVTRMTVPL